MSGLTFDANCMIEARDAKTGKVLHKQAVHNKIPNIGLTSILNLLSGTGQLPIAYFAVGSGNVAPAAGDTALGTERYRAATASEVVSGSTLTVSFVLGTGSANGYTLTEAGLFDLSSGGDLFARITYAGVAKTSSITLTYTWTINAASA